MSNLYRRTLLLGVAAVALVAWLAMAAAAATTSKPQVTLVTPFTSLSPDWNNVNRCFAQTVSKLGGVGKVVGPNQYDLTTEVNDIQAAVHQGTQGVATFVGDPKVFAPAFATLAQAHVPLVTIQSDAATPSQRIGLVTDDLSGLASEAAHQIIKKTNGKAHVGIISTGPQDQNQAKEIAAFEAVLKTSPGSSVVTTQYDNSDANTAATEASAMINAHPDMNVMWTTEGAAAPAIAAAVRNAHAAGKVLVVGVNLWPQTKQFISNGTMWGTFVQHFCWMGTTAATMLMDHLLGKHFAQPAHSEPGPFKQGKVIFPVSFVTKENLATAGGD